jgi:NACHT domain
MRRRTLAGWGLVAFAVVMAVAIPSVGAFRAQGDDAFNRWVGWATVAGLLIAAVGVLIALWDKMASREVLAASDIAETEDQLAAVVLKQAANELALLIGTDRADDEPANVRFVKGGSRFREVDGPGDGDLATVLEYYRSLSPGRLVVLGEPGAGKTVLAIELQVRLLEQRAQDKSGPVPVLVSAAAYDPGMAWEEWLAAQLALRFRISAKVTERLVRDGRVLPLVDGLDEMDLATSHADRAGALITALNAWMRGRAKAPVVVTCRREEYQALGHRVDRAAQVEMLPLSGEAIAGYLRGQFLDADDERQWEPVLAELEAARDGPLAELLATPWRLTLALAAFRDGDDPARLLPSAPFMTAEAAAQYTGRVDRQLLGSYVPAAVRLHDPDRRYPPGDVERWLTALADRTTGNPSRSHGTGSAVRLAGAHRHRRCAQAVAHRGPQSRRQAVA